MRAWLKKRTFLLQLIVTTLTVCCIPLTVLSGRLIWTQRTDMEHRANQRLQETAAAVAARFDDALDAIATVQLKYATLSELSASMLASGVRAEMEGLQTLRYLHYMLPFVIESGVVRPDQKTVYTTLGKYDYYIFAKLQLGLTEQELTGLLSASGQRRFVPWGQCGALMAYICPIRRGVSNVDGYGIYLINRTTLQEAVGSALPDGYTLSRIADADGTDVYVNSAAQGVRQAQATGRYGYTVCVMTQEEAADTQLHLLTGSLSTLVLLTAAASVLAAMASVFVNYQPIRKIVRKIPEQQAGAGEIDSIHTAFTSQRDEHTRLLRSYEAQKDMMLSRLYRACLNGRGITAGEEKLLADSARSYFVITANTEPSERMRRALWEQHGIRTVQLTADRLSAFICAGLGEEREAREKYAAVVRAQLNLPEARLAVSRAHHGVREFRTAYEECTAALDTVDGGTVFAEEIEGGGAWNYTEDSVQTMQLVKALKVGDDAVLDRARAMFAAIPHSDGPEYVWRYAAFHIAEYFQRIIRRTEYPLDEMEMARITGGESLRAVCELLCDLLSRVCESQRQQGMTAYQEKTREIIAYIDESCCDSTFDLNRIAENYGVTVPTASRILKEMLGVNFRSYLRTLRLEKAKRLLAETDLTVQEIAERVGFASQSYFIHVFKSAGDGTPAGYRAAVRGEREEKSV